MPPDDNGAHAIIPMHEQNLLDHLTKYEKKIMFIRERMRSAASYEELEYLISRHHGMYRPQGHGVETQPYEMPSFRDLVGPEGPLMRELEEITSALCDIHTMLTHLVGIEMTQPYALRRRAICMEHYAFYAVICLAEKARSVHKKRAEPKEFSEFQDLLKHVSAMFLRGGLDSRVQDQRRRELEKVKLGCDELAQTLEGLSIEQTLAEDETAMDLM